MDILKRVRIFLEDEEIPFMEEIHKRVFDDGVVVYAGAASDVEHAVLLGKNLVFFDTHLAEENVSEILRKIERVGEIKSVEKISELGTAKTTVDFEIGGVKFKLTYYAEDATKMVSKPYPELKNGIYTYFVKVPFPKECNVGSLREPEFFWRVLDMIRIGGFYLERECPISFSIPPQELGFEKVVSGYVSALSIRDAVGNLYRKVRKVKNLREFVFSDYVSQIERRSTH
jgi:hypothetical protein